MKVLLLMVFSIISSNLLAADPADGDLRRNDENKMTIWIESSSEWMTVESFWIKFSKTNGGHAWGKLKEYPEYNKVKEYDTLMIVTEKGECLMEFFHQRWRRANDVRRWNEALNNYAGCPYVFD